MLASQKLNGQGVERFSAPWRANEQEKRCDNLKTEAESPANCRGCEVCAKPGKTSCRVADDDENTMGTNHTASLMCWGYLGLEHRDGSVEHPYSKAVKKTRNQEHSLARVR